MVALRRTKFAREKSFGLAKRRSVAARWGFVSCTCEAGVSVLIEVFLAAVCWCPYLSFCGFLGGVVRDGASRTVAARGRGDTLDDLNW